MNKPKKPYGPGQIVQQAYGEHGDIAVGADGVDAAYHAHRQWVERLNTDEEAQDLAVLSERLR
jgi:hypothetical protein